MAVQRADNDDRPRRGVLQTLRAITLGAPSNGRAHGNSDGNSGGGSDGEPCVELCVDPCGNSDVGSRDNSHGNSAGGSRGGLDGGLDVGLDVGSHGNSRGNSDGEAHVEVNGAPDGDIVLQRHGDSIIVVDVDGSLAPSAPEYALAFLAYLQTHHPELCGGWLSSSALGTKFYPRFLEACRWPAMHWFEVSNALKHVAKKRPKQLTLFKDGKRKRCHVPQFKIPRPGRR